MTDTSSASLAMITAKIELLIKVLNLITIVEPVTDIVRIMMSLSFWERQIIALQQSKKAEDYILDHHNLVHIHEIPALMPDDTMNE